MNIQEHKLLLLAINIEVLYFQMSFGDRWEQVWNNRPILQIESEDDELQKLIFLDGFDQGAGRIEVDNWLGYLDWIKKKINVQEQDSIFEFGCGSGAILYPFYRNGHIVGGIDYSAMLVEYAKAVMPDMDITSGEVITVDNTIKYDIVISNSVFHYFPGYSYAEKAFEKMYNKARRKIAILEIPDLKRKSESERYRSQSLPEDEYKEKYKELEHLYYSREWFEKLAEKFDCNISIFDQNINEYGNSSYRFNCIIDKKVIY